MLQLQHRLCDIRELMLGGHAMTKASISWVEGMRFVAESGSGHGIVVDSSVENGGHNSGPRPMELLLMGLLGCTSMDVISILKKKRQPVRDLQVYATAEQAPENPHYFTKIHLEYVAYGNVAEDALARAIQLSEERYCSASATLKGRAEITSSYRVEKAELDDQPASVAA
jgi:putative redox protein